MKYIKFEIKNFKGIKELTIDLSKQPFNRIYTFVGLNESGKTTILEAINAIMKGFDNIETHKLIPKHLKANFSETISVTTFIKVDNDDNQKILEKFKELGYSDYQPINEFAIQATCVFENSIPSKDNVTYWDFHPMVKLHKSKKYKGLKAKDKEWQEIVGYIKSSLMPRIIYYEHFLFDFPSRIYLFGTKINDLNNKPYRDILDDIIQEIIPGSNIEKLYNNYTQGGEGNQDIFDAISTRLEEFISRLVFESWGKLFNSSNARVVLRFGIENENNNNNFYVEIKIKEN